MFRSLEMAAPEKQHEGRQGVDPELLKEVRLLQLRTDRLVSDVMAGSYRSAFRGSGIEFDEVREWAEGDDIRAVDWNVTARVGRPFIKKYVEERELTILFVLDHSRSMDFASEGRTLRRMAVEFCACVGLSAQRTNDKVGLVTFGRRVELFVPPRKGRSHVLRILREGLAPVGDPYGTGLADALRYAGRVQRKRAVVFVLSDFLGEDPFPALRSLSKRHDVVLAPCLDRRRFELEDAGLLRIFDLESGGECLVDTRSARVRARYAENARRDYEAFEKAAGRLGIDLLPLWTHKKVSMAVLQFFRRREARFKR
jgi:uncharacterized protein (DUF58 family)